MKVLKALALCFLVAGLLKTGQTCPDQWKMTAIGKLHTLAITPEGTLLSWGNNYFGQLGVSTDSTENLPPSTVMPGTKWIYVAASGASSYGIMADGTLWAFGNNNEGQLGDRTKTNRRTPVQIGSDSDWKMVAAGDEFVVGLKQDGSLFGWGVNNKAQLGFEPSDNKVSPTRIMKDQKFKFVSAQNDFTVAIKVDGTLWSMGYNSEGQLGISSSNMWSSARQVKVLTEKYEEEREEERLYGPDPEAELRAYLEFDDKTRWKTVCTGRAHTMAITEDGRLYGWGDNNFGALGDGTTTSANSPRLISDASWKEVGCGHDLTIGLLANGSLMSWGLNEGGVFGDGFKDGMHRTSPSLVGDRRLTWKALSVGYYVLAIHTNGSLFVWGEHKFGRELPILPVGIIQKPTIVCGPSCPYGKYRDMNTNKCTNSCDESCESCYEVTTKCTSCSIGQELTKSGICKAKGGRFLSRTKLMKFARMLKAIN